MELKKFSTINIDIPKDKIYARLGFARGKTLVDDKQKRGYADFMAQASELLALQGASLRLTITEKDGDKITLENNIIFKSISLAELLRDCDEVLLLGATAGIAIHDATKKCITTDEMTKGVVLDAVASECVDKSLDWIMEYFNVQLRREGKTFSRFRFSAGYGDFSLDNQRVFFDNLDLAQFGVCLTASSMFIPEKTVTAIVGIKKI
jgi:hypothetical protein